MSPLVKTVIGLRRRRDKPPKIFRLSLASKRFELASNAFYCVAMTNFVTVTWILRNV